MIIHSASVAVVAGVPALAEEPVAPVQESLIFFVRHGQVGSSFQFISVFYAKYHKDLPEGQINCLYSSYF